MSKDIVATQGADIADHEQEIARRARRVIRMLDGRILGDPADEG